MNLTGFSVFLVSALFAWQSAHALVSKVGHAGLPYIPSATQHSSKSIAIGPFSKFDNSNDNSNNINNINNNANNDNVNDYNDSPDILIRTASSSLDTTSYEDNYDNKKNNELRKEDKDKKEGTGGEGKVYDKVTYRSKRIGLLPGQVRFTDPNDTPIEFPEGKIAIKSFTAQVVNENGMPTPLNEVYLHHWLVFDGYGNSGVCGGYLGYKFGVGAESRRTSTSFPDGYALFTTGHETWGANIHVIRTTDVVDIQSCIECHCEGGGGGFACCPDGSFCDIKKDLPYNEKGYYLEYTIEYTTDTEGITPLDIYVLDVADCAIEYDVPQCRALPCVSTRSNTLSVPNDIDVVYILGHLHIGAINLTVDAYPPGVGDGNNDDDDDGDDDDRRVGREKGGRKENQSEDDERMRLCESLPTYGNRGDVAGDEYGYLVEMSHCSFVGDGKEPRSIPKGTKIEISAAYDNDPRHDSAMGLVYVAVVSTKSKLRRENDPRLWFSDGIFIAAFVFVVLAAVTVLGIFIAKCRRRYSYRHSGGDDEFYLQ